MFDEKIIDQVKELIGEELKSANRKFPLFASNHEACAVIFEEFEETHEEFELCAERLEKVWKATRSNRTIDFEDECVRLEQEATFLVYEALQVAAMARKALMSQDARKIIEGNKKAGGKNGI